jgi:hypothetical protein
MKLRVEVEWLDPNKRATVIYGSSRDVRAGYLFITTPIEGSEENEIEEIVPMRNVRKVRIEREA